MCHPEERRTPRLFPVAGHDARTADPSLTLGMTTLLARLWPLETCGFVSAWGDLEVGPDPGPIAVIDAGSGGLNHPSIRSRISKYVEPTSGTPSTGVHGGAVAATIAAVRDPQTMAGACSSRLHVYNVWTKTGFDSESCHHALDDAIASGCRVVNFSLGSLDRDAVPEAAVKRCIDHGIVVVAAMGDLESLGSPMMYPAGYDGVIAVGATDRNDLRRRGSSVGHHMSIAAPGDDIWSTDGDNAFRVWRGTSFSSAFVAAAAWLAVRRRPDLTPAEIKRCLEESAFPHGPVNRPNAELGHGRLDVARLASVLESS